MREPALRPRPLTRLEERRRPRLEEAVAVLAGELKSPGCLATCLLGLAAVGERLGFW